MPELGDLDLFYRGQAIQALMYRGQTLWTPNTGTPPVVVDPVGNVFKGISLAGAEFGHHDKTKVPGVENIDYNFNGQALITYLDSRGQQVLRIPVLWERFEEFMGGPLNASYIAGIQNLLNRAQSVGIMVLLDIHNYGRRWVGTTWAPAPSRFWTDAVEVMFGAGISETQYGDAVAKLTREFGTHPALWGIETMNEPHDLPSLTGSFSGTNRYTWDSSIQGWTGDQATAANVSGKLRLSGTASANGYFNLRKDDTGQMLGGALTGKSLSVVATLPAGTPGVWAVRVQYQNASYQWVNAPTTTYKRLDTGAAVNGLVAGVPVEVVSTYSAAFTPRAFALQASFDNAVSGTTYFVDFDNFAQGEVTASGTVWKNFSQVAVTAARGEGFLKNLVTNGDNWSSMKRWTEQGAPWITDPIPEKHWYGPHYYMDPNNDGNFAETFAQATAAAQAAGHTNVKDMITADVTPALEWARTNDVNMLVGELGWRTNGASDVAQWDDAGAHLYQLLRNYDASPIYWASGEWFGNDYELAPYTVSPLGTRSTSAVIEQAYIPVPIDVDPPPDPDPVVAPELPVPFYSAFNAESLEAKQEMASLGFTDTVIAFRWSALEDQRGELNPTELANLKQQFASAKTAGLGVIMSFSIHYMPEWVKSGTYSSPRFKGELGLDYVGANAEGNNIVDPVWSQTARESISAFQQLAWGALTTEERSQVRGFRLGGLAYGELHYPQAQNGQKWWGYSAPAQTGVGLATGMSQCPVPGYIPFQPYTNGGKLSIDAFGNEAFIYGTTEPTLANSGNRFPTETVITGTNGVFIPTDNTTYRRVRFECIVRADSRRNVVLEDCDIVGPPAGVSITTDSAIVECQSSLTSGVLLRHCTINPQNPSQYMHGPRGRGFTMERCIVINCVDGAGINQNGIVDVIIRGNYIADLAYFSPCTYQPDDRTHNDCIQILGGKAIAIYGNTLKANASPTAGNGFSATDPTAPAKNVYAPSVTGQGIAITPNQAAGVSDVDIYKNWLDYGSQSVTIKNGTGIGANVSVTENRYGRNQALLTKSGTAARRAMLVDPDVTQTIVGVPAATGTVPSANNIHTDNSEHITVWRLAA